MIGTFHFFYIGFSNCTCHFFAVCCLSSKVDIVLDIEYKTPPPNLLENKHAKLMQDVL